MEVTESVGVRIKKTYIRGNKIYLQIFDPKYKENPEKVIKINYDLTKKSKMRKLKSGQYAEIQIPENMVKKFQC